MHDYVNLEIKKKSGLSLNPDIHHSKVPSSDWGFHSETFAHFLRNETQNLSFVARKKNSNLRYHSQKSFPAKLSYSAFSGHLMWKPIILNFYFNFSNIFCRSGRSIGFILLRKVSSIFRTRMTLKCGNVHVHALDYFLLKFHGCKLLIELFKSCAP